MILDTSYSPRILQAHCQAPQARAQTKALSNSLQSQRKKCEAFTNTFENK